MDHLRERRRSREESVEEDEARDDAEMWTEERMTLFSRQLPGEGNENGR